MLSFIKKIFGISSTDFKKLYNEGAQIIDVRTSAEFNNGNIKNSINIPLQNLNGDFRKINTSKPVITCCESGMRSASAQLMLKQKGFEVYNGGGWRNLKKKIEG